MGPSYQCRRFKGNLSQLPYAKPSKENDSRAKSPLSPLGSQPTLQHPYGTAAGGTRVSANCCGAARPDEKVGWMPGLPLCSVHRLAAGAGALFIIQFS